MPLSATSTPPSRSRPACEALRWRRVRVASVGATVAAVAVIGSLTLTSHEEASAATLVSTAAVPVAVGSDNPPVPTNPAEMPMDMPGMDMSGSSPAPTAPADMPQDMPGMDMSGSHEHSDATGAAAHRPLVPVLGTFGGATSAVLLTAGMMRRKDRELSLAKKATRLAGRAKK
jgi:hypothetical protein